VACFLPALQGSLAAQNLPRLLNYTLLEKPVLELPLGSVCGNSKALPANVIPAHIQTVGYNPADLRKTKTDNAENMIARWIWAQLGDAKQNYSVKIKALQAVGIDMVAQMLLAESQATCLWEGLQLQAVQLTHNAPAGVDLQAELIRILSLPAFAGAILEVNDAAHEISLQGIKLFIGYRALELKAVDEDVQLLSEKGNEKNKRNQFQFPLIADVQLLPYEAPHPTPNDTSHNLMWNPMNDGHNCNCMLKAKLTLQELEAQQARYIHTRISCATMDVKRYPLAISLEGGYIVLYRLELDASSTFMAQASAEGKGTTCFLNGKMWLVKSQFRMKPVDIPMCVK